MVKFFEIIAARSIIWTKALLGREFVETGVLPKQEHCPSKSLSKQEHCPNRSLSKEEHCPNRSLLKEEHCPDLKIYSVDMSILLKTVRKKRRSLQRDSSGKENTKIHYLSGEEFKLVIPLARDIEGAVSIAVQGKAGWYLRIKGPFCFLEREKQSRNFEKDCSFYPLVNLWFPDFVAFESVSKAAHYLRMKDGRMILDHYDGTARFKEEASFKLNKLQRRTIVEEEIGRPGREATFSSETATRAVGSDCQCSECVSEISFQIYEEDCSV